MAKIYVGTEVLRTKAAINHLKKNIAALHRKLNGLTPNCEVGTPLIALYTEKLASQQSLLVWLQNATR